MKKCCIVIVTYNAGEWIDVCLKPFLNLPEDMAVVVVDNASSDETISVIKKKYKFVKLFNTGENLGFGRANNIGMRWAYNNGFEHVFLLNQDAEIDVESLRELCDYQDKYPQYYCLSPMQITPMAKDNVDEKNQKFHIEDVDFCAAALWMLSRKCLSVVGVFNPSFIHIHEDGNYAQRIFFHGGKIGVVQNVKGYHYCAESAAKRSHFATMKKTWRYIVYDLSDPYVTNDKKCIVKWHIRLLQRLLLSVISFNFKKSSIYYQLIKKLNKEKKEIYENKMVSRDTGAFL